MMCKDGGRKGFGIFKRFFFLENLLEYHTSWECSHQGVRNVSLGRNVADFLLAQ